MTEAVLIILMVFLLGIYVVVSPSRSRTGPFLPDAYLIGVGLYTVGALIVEWSDIHSDADVLALMSIAAMLTSTLGAIFFCLVTRRIYANASFKNIHKKSRIDSKEYWIINVLIAASAAVCVYFFYQILSSDILSQLFTLTNILQHSTLSVGRDAITFGSAGYLAPGYIKQFRDTVFPLTLCAMILLYPRPLRSKAFWGVLVITVGAMLVMAQRVNLVLLTLALATSGYYAGAMKRAHASRKPPIGSLVLVGVIVLVSFTALSAALGRDDDTDGPLNYNADKSVLQVPGAAISSFVTRVVITLPSENVRTYPIWGSMGPTHGEYWAGEFESIVNKGAYGQSVQAYMSNVLAIYLGAGIWGNSPLGLPADIWYTWGWVGLFVVPPIFAILFGILDLVLLSERSALFFAMKIYLFFVIPQIVSPYLFVLYGGAVCIVLIVYIKLSHAVYSRLALSYHRSAFLSRAAPVGPGGVFAQVQYGDDPPQADGNS